MEMANGLIDSLSHRGGPGKGSNIVFLGRRYALLGESRRQSAFSHQRPHPVYDPIDVKK